MRLAIALWLAGAAAAGAENLLSNPSFETSANNMPVGWNVFVQPKEGALAILDQRVGKDGSNSVRLSIETPYIEDPANNWSQNLIADVRGKRLAVNGFIKTEDAGEAAIWVQCYRKTPLRMVTQVSSGDTGVMGGTKDWTPVSFTVDVPESTEFVVVRCVLRGRGMAWFDALSVQPEAVPASAALSTDLPSVKMPTPPKIPDLPPPALLTETTIGTRPPAELIQAQEELRQANDELRQSNAAMAKQLEALRAQLDELKRQVGETTAAAKQLQAEQPKKVEREKPVKVPPPPLVSGDALEGDG